ncbi:hypothetical protein [uncultured Phocaeicola sp.]|uniref:hypothetical protein n=1 Tax=uncultured Phocaeicola sp. TaxID=990718 RepID=UPI0025A15B65|nr:hypothetical protein [uncultured Phocaeicola sp.]
MIKIEKTEVMGWESAIRGMRNPMNSWNRSDSGICGRGDMHIGCDNCANRIPCNHSFDGSWQLGQEDHCLMMKLAKAGSVHGKFRRMITVYVDITAPIYFWSEFDTYKVGTVANSTSTMHKIHAKEFTLDDFSCEHLKDFDGYQDPVTNSPAITWFKMLFNDTIEHLNMARKLYLQTGDKQYWWQMIQLLPNSYHYTRTVMLNYEVLSGIYIYRKNHKLDEWREFCQWIEKLPYSEIITCNAEEVNNNA